MPPSLRDTLFGDLPLDAWPATPETTEPWASFIAARTALRANRIDEATALWRRLADDAHLEPRHTLQAWTFLRAHGIQPPPDRMKLLLGVVIEVPMPKGLDLLAAYPDRTARYYNHSGRGVVWEHADASLDEPIDAVLRAGQQILDIIGPWDKPRPAPPPPGKIRLNILAPSGLHFGEGDFNILAKEPLAKPLIDAATALMIRITKLPAAPRA